MQQSEMRMSKGPIEMSMPIELSGMSLSIGNVKVSMPIETLEMRMSMGMIEVLMPVDCIAHHHRAKRISHFIKAKRVPNDGTK
jgi:hypothetical protein